MVLSSSTRCEVGKETREEKRDGETAPRRDGTESVQSRRDHTEYDENTRSFFTLPSSSPSCLSVDIHRYITLWQRTYNAATQPISLLLVSRSRRSASSDWTGTQSRPSPFFPTYISSYGMQCVRLHEDSTSVLIRWSLVFEQEIFFPA